MSVADLHCISSKEIFCTQCIAQKVANHYEKHTECQRRYAYWPEFEFSRFNTDRINRFFDQSESLFDNEINKHNEEI